MEKKFCKFCGKELKFPKYLLKNKKYCNRECYIEEIKRSPIKLKIEHEYKKMKWFDFLVEILKEPKTSHELNLKGSFDGCYRSVLGVGIPIKRFKYGRLSRHNNIKSLKGKKPITIYYIKGQEIEVLKRIYKEYGMIPSSNKTIKALFGKRTNVVHANGLKGICFDFLNEKRGDEE